MTAGTAGRRSRVAAPAVAAWSLGVLIVLFFAALVLLAFAARAGGIRHHDLRRCAPVLDPSGSSWRGASPVIRWAGCFSRWWR